jgi:hypothetical protein
VPFLLPARTIRSSPPPHRAGRRWQGLAPPGPFRPLRAARIACMCPENMPDGICACSWRSTTINAPGQSSQFFTSRNWLAWRSIKGPEFTHPPYSGPSLFVSSTVLVSCPRPRVAPHLVGEYDPS